ncbi:hypothetical protein D3C71_1326380 [compost metagenome]
MTYESKWYIMSAGSWMRKPSIGKIVTENGHNGIITVATITKPYPDKPQKIFLLGAGDSPYGDNGSIQNFVYDTGNGHRKPGYGVKIEVENSIIISGTEVIDQGNGIGMDEKRSLYVFK